MNVKRARLFYLGLIIVFLLIISYCIYFLLGGFNEVKVYESSNQGFTVFGKFFDDARDAEFTPHGQKCRELIESGAINGELTILLYPNDTLRDVELDRFVGISTSEEMAEIPSDFEVRELSIPKSIVLEIRDMHILVQPRPDKIESQIKDYAKEKGFELVEFYIIKYGESDSETTFVWPLK